MRSVKKWRHYCDFCSKARMVKSTMVKHETGCTLNPNRVCGLCVLIGNIQAPMQDLKDALLADTKNLTALRKMCNDCPACILAALRQHNKGVEDVADMLWPEFDFKAEMASFWKDYNESQRPNYAYG